MRTLAVVLAAALLAFPLGVAADGPGRGGPDDPRPARDGPRDRCAAEAPPPSCQAPPPCRPARAEPGRPAPEPDNGTADGNGTSDGAPGNATGNATAPPPPACPVTPPCPDPCPPACREAPRSRQCRVERAPLYFPMASARDVTFVPDGANHTIRDLQVGGLQVLDAIILDANATLHVERHGREVRVEGDNFRLELHDNPTGQVRFKGGNSTVTLVFPEGIQLLEPGLTTRIRYADGSESFLNAHEVTWDVGLRTAVVEDFMVFHLSERAAAGFAHAASQPPADLERGLESAADDRRLGAQVTVRRPQAALAAEDAVQVVPYDDVNVTVDVPDRPAPGVPVKVTVSADLEEGRTIALDVDPELVQTTDPRGLLLRYFDVHADGSETEVLFATAASLADVLDPMDDGGQPEYWIVSDGDGLHILVSVPHWSVHAITVSSIVDFVTQPSVLVGIAAGVAGSVAAAAMVLWPRRRRDDGAELA